MLFTAAILEHLTGLLRVEQADHPTVVSAYAGNHALA